MNNDDTNSTKNNNNSNANINKTHDNNWNSKDLSHILNVN